MASPRMKSCEKSNRLFRTLFSRMVPCGGIGPYSGRSSPGGRSLQHRWTASSCKELLTSPHFFPEIRSRNIWSTISPKRRPASWSDATSPLRSIYFGAKLSVLTLKETFMSRLRLFPAKRSSRICPLNRIGLHERYSGQFQPVATTGLPSAPGRTGVSERHPSNQSRS